VLVLPLKKYQGRIISSTWIREALLSHDFQLVRKLINNK
jgi:citrate lyase synthetase